MKQKLLQSAWKLTAAGQHAMARLFIFLALCCDSKAGQVDVVCTNSDFEGRPLVIRSADVYFLDGPLATGTNLISKDWVTYRTDLYGAFTITNVYPGNYRIEFRGPKTVTTNWYEFPATNGTINAGDPTYHRAPTNGVIQAFTLAAGNSLYVQRMNGISTNLEAHWDISGNWGHGMVYLKRDNEDARLRFGVDYSDSAPITTATPSFDLWHDGSIGLPLLADGAGFLKAGPQGIITSSSRLPNYAKGSRPTSQAGTAIYQTDATPGLRVYNGTHWVKYTEANDD